MKGFGVFLLVLYPGAFVDIATDQLLSLSPWQQLRIFCAGVWHNIVIVVVALIILLSLPSLLAPFYVSGQSVLVTTLTEVCSDILFYIIIILCLFVAGVLKAALVEPSLGGGDLGIGGAGLSSGLWCTSCLGKEA